MPRAREGVRIIQSHPATAVAVALLLKQGSNLQQPG